MFVVENCRSEGRRLYYSLVSVMQACGGTCRSISSECAKSQDIILRLHSLRSSDRKNFAMLKALANPNRGSKYCRVLRRHKQSLGINFTVLCVVENCAVSFHELNTSRCIVATHAVSFDSVLDKLARSRKALRCTYSIVRLYSLTRE